MLEFQKLELGGSLSTDIKPWQQIQPSIAIKAIDRGTTDTNIHDSPVVDLDIGISPSRLPLNMRNTHSTSLMAVPLGISPSRFAPSISSPLSAANHKLKDKHLSRYSNEVYIGTPIKEGHVNYLLMFDMLTGIRITVSRFDAKPVGDLIPADFTAAHKLAFDTLGNELIPTSRYDFKFKDYAPLVFRKVRELLHVDQSEYLSSLTGKYLLSEMASCGKSGSFFYYSRDYRFIIKTINHSEHKFFVNQLADYYTHIKTNPHTMLSRIFGLHRVKLPGNQKIHFVVMGNVFPPNKDVHQIFDLKGSLLGRSVSMNEVKLNPGLVMKDLNWIQEGKSIKLGPDKSSIFCAQMRRDVHVIL